MGRDVIGGQGSYGDVAGYLSQGQAAFCCQLSLLYMGPSVLSMFERPFRGVKGLLAMIERPFRGVKELLVMIERLFRGVKKLLAMIERPFCGVKGVLKMFEWT